MSIWNEIIQFLQCNGKAKCFLCSLARRVLLILRVTKTSVCSSRLQRRQLALFIWFPTIRRSIQVLCQRRIQQNSEWNTLMRLACYGFDIGALIVVAARGPFARRRSANDMIPINCIHRFEGDAQIVYTEVFVSRFVRVKVWVLNDTPIRLSKIIKDVDYFVLLKTYFDLSLNIIYTRPSFCYL